MPPLRMGRLVLPLRMNACSYAFIYTLSFPLSLALSPGPTPRTVQRPPPLRCRESAAIGLKRIRVLKADQAGHRPGRPKPPLPRQRESVLIMSTGTKGMQSMHGFQSSDSIPSQSNGLNHMTCQVHPPRHLIFGCSSCPAGACRRTASSGGSSWRPPPSRLPA